MLGGGGVDGAIHRKGGPQILKECMEIRNRQGSCAIGQAVITSGGNLPAAYVIHTVGPVWNGGNNNERIKLKECYTNSLKLALAKGLKTIAFPNISTGIYHFPKEEATAIAIDAVFGFEDKDLLECVWFVCFDEESFNIYKKKLLL